MATKRHPAEWGPRDTQWDRYIQEILADRGFGHEREYFGCTTRDRAEEVRKGIRNAARYFDGVSVKAFWRACTGCQPGGTNCRFHVYYTCYQKDAAREYKARVANSARES